MFIPLSNEYEDTLTAFTACARLLD